MSTVRVRAGTPARETSPKGNVFFVSSPLGPTEERDIAERQCLFLFFSYRMKLVLNGLSCSGCPSSPTFSLRIIQAMLRPSVRIVCMPSSSCAACPGVWPYTLFQYWELTTGIFRIVKYLFRRSKAADAPPLRHTTTLAPGLNFSSFPKE